MGKLLSYITEYYIIVFTYCISAYSAKRYQYKDPHCICTYIQYHFISTLMSLTDIYLYLHLPNLSVSFQGIDWIVIMGRGCGPATLICLYWIPLISSDQFSHMPYYCHALPGLPKQLYTRLTLSIASSYSHYHLCSSKFVNVICTSFFSFTMVFHTTCLTAKAALPASAAFAHPSLSLMLEPNSLIQTLAKHC